MKPQNMFCFILLLALESNMIKSCFAASKLQAPLSQWQVTILNQMAASTLVVHCKSKDDDLGEHVLATLAKYDWTFKENLLQTTLYWCNFSSKYGQVTGDVFWPEKGTWLSEQCEHNSCLWAAGDQGIYLHLGPLNGFKLMYHWK